MKEKIEIGKPLHCLCHWYDHGGADQNRAVGAIIVGWKPTQIVAKIEGYGVVRFWKKSLLEVGNSASELRGWRLELPETTTAAKGLDVPIALDTEA